MAAIVSPPSDPTVPPIDKKALQEKYRQERDKRLRPDGSGQYIRLKG